MAKHNRSKGMESMHDFKVKINMPVRWGDMDAFQHVNNTVYVKWIENVRVEYLMHLNGGLQVGDIGPILARIECTYIYPIRFPDTVTVCFKTLEILDDRLICEARIFSDKNQRLCCISKNVIMAYDFKDLQKVNIPEGWKSKIISLDQI